MAQAVPADDLPGSLVPEGDLPEAPEEGLISKAIKNPYVKFAARQLPGVRPMELLNKYGELSEEAGGRVTDITGSPLAGTAAYTALSAVPMLMGGAGTKKVPLSSIGSVKAETLKAADDLGYIVPPSARGGGFLSKRLESIGGKAAVGQEAAIRNQVVTNAIAAKEASLPAGTPITEGALAAAREQLAAPYKAIAQVSPVANRALERLKIARNDAKGLWNFYNRSADPRVLKEAQALDRTAETLERVIEREATKVGQPELIGALREARKAIAKNYTVEKALNVGSGDVDAKVIGRMLDQGKPLSGDLKTVGKFAQAFGPYAREASGIPTPGVSKSEAILATILGAGGAGATQYSQGSPYGVALGALPLLATPARGAVLSRAMRPGLEGVPLSGILRRPLQGSMIPLSEMNPWEVERE